MPEVTYVQSSFLGGEVSQSAQGGIARPDYRTEMNVCLNTIPMEAGNTQRRPGTRHAMPTRGGLPAKVLAFDFKAATPYVMEFTDEALRFRTGIDLVTNNDVYTLASISSASPAVFTTTTVTAGFLAGKQVIVRSNVTQLMNRSLIVSVALSPTTFNFADAITGVLIDGSTLDALTSGTVAIVHELSTPYTTGSWASVRAVQAETSAVLLQPSFQPQILTATLPPTVTQHATFTITPTTFLDGPYLDPVPGSWVTPSAQSGVITLTFRFQDYDSTKAYNIGDYVNSGGQGYKSLTANNQGNAPAGSPSNWLAVNGGDPVNGGQGFTNADIGRLLRLFSEPPLWAAASTYSAKDTVAYPDGSTGGFSYWTANNSVSAGIQPGTSTLWAINPAGALWTWARIVTISNSGAASPGAPFGNMTGNGGLAAAFDGTLSKSLANSAQGSVTIPTYPVWAQGVYAVGSIVQFAGFSYQKIGTGTIVQELAPPLGSSLWLQIGTVSSGTIDGYVGEFFGAGKIVQSVVVYPSNNFGLTNGVTVTLNLRAKTTAPASASDGTLLGSTGSIGNTVSAIGINSNDSTTSWNYVWIEAVASFIQPLADDGTHFFTGQVSIGQIVVFTPNAANGSVITAQVAGDALLYSGVVRKWRLGVYGGANGWPACGTYEDDRIWLSGVIDNRVDASKTGASSTLPKGYIDFAPTAPNGTVAADNAIAATATGTDVNSIFWMVPDQQGIICGTQGGEFVIRPASTAAGLVPGNVDFTRHTKVGCANIEPRRTDHTLVMVQKFRRDIQEMFADVFSGKFSAPSLEDLARHTTAGNIAEIGYQQKLTSTVWARLENGKLVGVTYKRDTLSTARGPDIKAHHRHVLGHSRPIVSMTVGATADGNLDALYLVTRDDVASGIHLHNVEVVGNLLDEGFAIPDICFLDDAIAPPAFLVQPNATASAPYGGIKLYGLSVHAGKNVTVYACGLDCNEQIGSDGSTTYINFFPQADGSLFVPFGDGISSGAGRGKFTMDLVNSYGATPPIFVGFTFTSDGQTVRAATPQESGTPNGPGWGRPRQTHRLMAQLYGAVNGTVSFGSSFDTLKPAKFNNNTTRQKIGQLGPLDFFNGIWVDSVDCESDFDNMLCWRISRPHPLFVSALGARVKTEV